MNVNCNVQKLLSQLTMDPTTLFSTLIGRVGGAFISQIPTILGGLGSACTTYQFAIQVARLFSIITNYYI